VAPGESWPLACSFLPFGDGDTVAGCAHQLPDGAIELRPEALAGRGEEDGETDGGGVYTVMVDGALLFAVASGRTAPALPFDNGADYFVEGLARTLRDGKIGFVNDRLEVVVPPTWDFAFPFDGGVARVCEGCTLAPVGAGDEHSEVVGGRWGLIDRQGRVVVPVVHQRDDPAAQAVPEPG